MNREEQDRDLRRAFDELRKEDRRRLPSFERVLARPSAAAAPRSERRRLLWAAATGLGLIALIGGLVLSRRSPTPEPSSAVAALAAWRSPTAALLRTPGRELRSGLPRVGDLDLSSLGAVAPRPKDADAVPLSGRKETIP